MKCLLTKSVIDKALQAKQRTQLWDTKVLGLYAEIRDNGRGSFFIRHTLPESGKKTVLVGPVGVLSVTDAREKARSLLNQAYMGEDLIAKRKLQSSCPTVNQVFEQYYLPFVKTYKRSWITDDSLYKNHVAEQIGHLPLIKVREDDIANLQQQMRFKGLSPSTCNRVITLLRFLFNLAIKRWKIKGFTENPTQDIQFYPVHNQQQTFLTPDAITRLHKATQAQRIKPHIVAFLSLTGVRKRNALDAKWQEIDWVNQSWTIPITKSGRSQTVFLSAEALQLLASVPRDPKNSYIFPNAKTGMPYQSIYSSWDKSRKAAQLPNVRLHDLRHTFASLLINSGHSLYVVQKALGHNNPRITARYAHLADSTLRNANQSVGAMVKNSLQTLLETNHA